MQKGLNRRRDFMRALQGKGVAGVIYQADLDIWQLRLQGLRCARRNQGILTGEQMQLRPDKRL